MIAKRLAGYKAVAVFVAALLLSSLAGCKFSDTITEVIYDQDEKYEIDYSVDPVYINSPTAELTSDDLPSLTPVAAGSDDPLESAESQQGSLDEAESQNPIEGQGSSLSEDRSSQDNSQQAPNQGDQRAEADNDTPRTKPGSGSNGASDEDDSDESAARGEESDGGISVGEGDGDAQGDNPGEGADSTAGDSGSSNAGGEVSSDTGQGEREGEQDSQVGRTQGRTFSDTGDNDELPDDVKTVAAVGAAAVVASALGGADGNANLVASDAELLGSAASKVLAARGIANAVAAWAHDGTGAGDANLALLLESKPDACLISEGDATLSADDQAKLLDNGTHIVYVPSMDNASKTLACVQRIGVLLGKGGDAAAQAASDSYTAFWNSIADEAEKAESRQRYTLYITQWITGVTYQGKYSSEVTVNGLAFSPTGSLAQPMSSFLDMAGVSNTATSKTRYANLNKMAVVWPLLGGTNDSDWRGVSSLNGGLSTMGNDYELGLMRFVTPTRENFDLGTASFPAIIASNSDIQAKIKADRDQKRLYSAESHETSSIASDSYRIVVNPCGLIGSWSEASMESILETAWASNVFQQNSSNDSYVQGRVKKFYQDFYGYDLGDDECKAILDGSYAE